MNNGDVLFITILAENNNGQPARTGACERWHNEFPNDNIAVLGDLNRDALYYWNLMYFPTTMVLDENMVIQNYNIENPTRAFDNFEASL